MKVETLSVKWTSRKAFVTDVYKQFRSLGLSQDSATLLVAHVALSTGWGAHANNYRLAGIKAGNSCVCSGTCPPTYSGNYTCNEGTEFINGKEVSAVMPFRAYASLAEGAKAILSILQSTRYTKSRTYLLEGSENYFEQVGLDGWYTANPQKIAQEMRKNHAIIRQYLGLPPVSTGMKPLLGLTLIFGVGAGVYWWKSRKE